MQGARLRMPKQTISMSDSDATPPAAKAAEGSCSTIEAAQQLGTSVQTVQRWMDRGYLRGWRTPGGHRRVDVASVREFLERAKAQVDSPRINGSPRTPGIARVVIVDDSSDDLELLAAVAKVVMPRAELIMMSNGFAALTAIGQAPPDLLITDVAMPGIDGIEMIRSLRDLPRFATLPVIAVSTYTSDELSGRFGSLPDDLRYMRKPVTPSALRLTIAEAAPLLVSA